MREPTDTEQRSNSQELRVSLDETRAERERGDDDEVYNQGPLAAIAISQEAEENGAEGAEEESQGDGRRDVGRGLVELFREEGDRQADREEVPGV